MFDKLDHLLESMKEARETSDIVSARAYELRQKAIRLQFEANSAIEAVDLISEILRQCKDPELIHSISKNSLEAIMKAADCTLIAIEAVEQANEADKEVTKVLLVAKEAAENLSDALKELTSNV